jgi:hypothetical protein
MKVAQSVTSPSVLGITWNDLLSSYGSTESLGMSTIGPRSGVEKRKIEALALEPACSPTSDPGVRLAAHSSQAWIDRGLPFWNTVCVSHTDYV